MYLSFSPHSLTHSSPHSLTPSFPHIHPLTHILSLPHPLTHSPPHSYMPSLIYPLTPSCFTPTYSPPHSHILSLPHLPHPLTHSPPHSHILSLPHPLTHSPPHSCILSLPHCRHERVIEEPEVIYEASDESEEEETQRQPVHRIIESDSER